mmetsp:Transcript_22561/g.62615  ORF Transcript_22561/g.62615 Transcript_22561/m.62615 type:complete len:215 (-) Transcript_22561:2424-3068(-)
METARCRQGGGHLASRQKGAKSRQGTVVAGRGHLPSGRWRWPWQAGAPDPHQWPPQGGPQRLPGPHLLPSAPPQRQLPPMAETWQASPWSSWPGPSSAASSRAWPTQLPQHQPPPLSTLMCPTAQCCCQRSLRARLRSRPWPTIRGTADFLPQGRPTRSHPWTTSRAKAAAHRIGRWKRQQRELPGLRLSPLRFGLPGELHPQQACPTRRTEPR